MRDLDSLALTQDHNGYVHLLARRETKADDGSRTVAYLHATQYQSGRHIPGWHSIGNPYQNPRWAAGVGTPALAVDATDQVCVFVPNGDHSVHTRIHKDRGWKPWKDLQVREIHDALAVHTLSDGRLEALVAGPRRAVRWYQTEPGGPFAPAEEIGVQLAGVRGTAVETAPGHLTYYWPDTRSGGLMGLRAGWAGPVGGTAAPVAATRTWLNGYDYTVLAQQGAGGHVLLGACGTGHEMYGVQWAEMGRQASGAPALAHDAHGRLVLAVIDPSGALCVSRQKPGADALSMDRWVRTG